MIQNDVLNINKAIYNVLKSNAAITAKVGTKIYPLVADVKTTFPFIVYQRTDSTLSRCKDGEYEANIGITIQIEAATYDESIEISNLVNSALLDIEYKKINDIYIDEIQMTSCSETFNNDVFIQQINYNVIIQ